MKKTKVVCTIGPASEQKETLAKLIGAGMNVMRMNFSHGDYEEQGFRVKNVRELNKENGWNVGLMLDTKGPEIRSGLLKEDYAGVMLNKGDKIVLTMDYSFVGGMQKEGFVKVAISYAGLYDDIEVGGRILFEDGLTQLVVKEKDAKNRELICEVLTTRKLKPKRNCNVPGVKLNMEYISPKDKADIEWACDQNLDFIAASFVRRPQDIADIRAILAAKCNTRIKIMSKIENAEGVENMEEIVALSDGVMVARGDLGVDVDAWDLPQIQKEMIYRCQSAGKYVVTATQMLDSMIERPRPTRAEVSDVHNAVLDGTGATMLSGESAQGDYPFEAVSYMAKIDEVAEDFIDYEDMIERATYGSDPDDKLAQLAAGVARMALDYDCAAIVAEGSYEFAMKLSSFRPCADVFYGVATEDDARSLALAWGIQAVVGNMDAALKVAVEKDQIQAGETVLKVTEAGVSVVTL